MVSLTLSADIRLIPALRHLNTDVTTAIADVARKHHLKSGDVLLYQGDTLRSIYAVLSGGVRLVNYGEDGQSVALKIYAPGDVFGLLAVSGGYAHPTQIEAIHEGIIVSIDGDNLRSLMMTFPELGLTIVDMLTAHVHEAHGRIRAMAVNRVDRRLARSLLHLSAKFGRIEDERIVLNVPLSQRDLAEFIGTTVETVNRILTQWQKQNLVTCGHKRVVILNHVALEDIAENRSPIQTTPPEN